MSESQALTVIQNPQSSLMKVDDVIQQMVCVQDLMRRAMNGGQKNGDDFGTIPGCGDKPALKKPGAEKLNILFRLAPTYKVAEVSMEHGHREYRVTCTLTHIPTGNVYGQGEGLCSTMETKYRWRKSERVCPQCNAPAIIKGKADYGGGWVCFNKKGGCGAKFMDGDTKIEGQATGRAENPDVADQYNTVLKMACKRAMVAATLNATGASALFTQDIDDMAPQAMDGDAAMDEVNTPRAPTTPNAPAKAAPTGKAAPAAGCFDDIIVKVTPRPYKKAGKDATFWIVDTSDGSSLATFSETIKTHCEDAMSVEQVVGIEWEDNGKGRTIKALVAALEPVN